MGMSYFFLTQCREYSTTRTCTEGFAGTGLSTALQGPCAQQAEFHTPGRTQSSSHRPPLVCGVLWEGGWEGGRGGREGGRGEREEEEEGKRRRGRGKRENGVFTMKPCSVR